MLVYYVIDTETSGLKLSYHEITQISIVRCSDRHQFSRYIKIEHPERSSHDALQVTGRTIRDLYQGDPKAEVVDAIDAWLAEDGKTPEHRCMIAHNDSFDRRFCHELWKSLGKTFPTNYWLDTRKLAKLWANKLGLEKPSFTLVASLEFTGIKPVPGANHNAITDSRNAYLLWKKAMDENLDYLSCIKRVPQEE